jgi:hypothetical protein
VFRTTGLCPQRRALSRHGAFLMAVILIVEDDVFIREVA